MTSTERTDISTDQDDNTGAAAGCGCFLVGLIGLALPVVAYLEWAEWLLPSWPLWAWIVVGALIAFVAGPLVGVSLDDSQTQETAPEEESAAQPGSQGRHTDTTQKDKTEEQVERAEVKVERREEPHNAGADVNRIGSMGDAEFERFVSDLFRKQGHTVTRVSDSTGEGANLLVEIEGRKVIVQLRPQAEPVGSAAVHAAFAGMIVHDAQEAWLMTTSSFNRSAMDLARKIGVQPIDRNDLAEGLETLGHE